MQRKSHFFTFLCLSGLSAATITCAQDAPAPARDPVLRQEVQEHNREVSGQRPLLGKITAMHDGTLEVTRPDGQAVTVKVTDQTEFRRDRQPAKAADFKVGDLIMVRGDENPDHTVTAKTIGARTGTVGAGGPGTGGGGMFFSGTMGKDFVAGQIKSIDPPRLTVLRTDNVTQTLELNENTTLRRGRDSITMADIQVGDRVVAHGAVQDNVFVPQGVVVMSPEQWQRMQEFMGQANGGKVLTTPDAPAPKP